MIRVLGSLAFDTVGLVERLPDPDTTARILRLETRSGGTAGNVAVALARLGARVALASAAGPDFAGSAYEERLVRDGVDVQDLVRVPQATAHAYVWSEPDGRQCTYYFPGASHAFGDVPVRAASLAHFSAGSIDLYPAHMEAAERVTFDPGQELFHRPVEDVTGCLPHVDVLFLNEHERARLERVAAFTEKAAWDLGLEAVVVTSGRAGAEVRTPEGTVRVPSVPASYVDATGAGDAHRAGFLLGLARDLPLEACARLGAVLAAFVVEGVGPQESLPGLAAFRERYTRAFGAWPL